MIVKLKCRIKRFVRVESHSSIIVFCEKKRKKENFIIKKE